MEEDGGGVGWNNPKDLYVFFEFLLYYFLI
jgi:hypothetical protein